MTKHEFILRLREGLAGIPQSELDERLDFYKELIDDRIDEGHSEEDAVSDVGNVDTIIAQILSEIPISTLIKEKVKPKRKIKTREIILIILGFPVWLPLLISGAAVIVSLYVSIWSVIISLWAVFASFVACSLAGLIAGVGIMICTRPAIGLAMLSAGIVLAGLSIFVFFGCKAASDGTVKLTKLLILKLKSCFIKKEVA